MERIRLGTTDLVVSRLCLGTATFGGQCDVAASHQVLARAAAAGVNFIDTADTYPLGRSPDTIGSSERIVGDFIRGRRGDFVIATKCDVRTGPAAIDGSLRRLGTDYVDLYQLHGPNPEVPIERTVELLDAVVRSGKARYIGCSNFQAAEIAAALGTSDARGFARFVSVQPRHNLLFRQLERELLPFCAREGLAVLAYNPLAGGLLSGKHEAAVGPDPAGRFSFPQYRARYWHDRHFAAVAAIRAVAADAGIDVITLAISWVLASRFVACAILGVSRPEQLPPALVADPGLLTPEVRARLDALTAEFREGDATR